MQYPSSWDKDLNVTSPDIVTFYPHAINSNASLTVTVDNISDEKGIPLAQYAADSNDAIKHRTKDFKLLGSTTNNTLAGLPAYKSVYTYAGRNNSTVQGVEIGAIKGDKVYIFTYEAGPNEYDTYFPMIRNMIYSVQITSQISPQPNVISPQPKATSETASQLVGDTQLQEYAVVFPPLVNMHSGVYHNEKGVFVPWKTICNKTQQYLVESCDSLINSDGSLTSGGDRAVGCIWNGAIIAGAANIAFAICHDHRLTRRSCTAYRLRWNCEYESNSIFAYDSEFSTVFAQSLDL